jgi:undecaprenyl diphosphate synthase
MDHTGQAPNFPRHIAIAMDGNGRWATERGLPRAEGHRQGAFVAYNIAMACAERKLSMVTLYAFSVENWRREASEVGFLLEELFPDLLVTFSPALIEKNIRLRLLGEYRLLPARLMEVAQSIMAQTEAHTGMRLNLAIGYSGRREILHALRQTVAEVGLDGLNTIDEAAFARHLYTHNMPDPDLYIRCGRANRISNFMLWQMAYTELLALDVLWPDFTAAHLDSALQYYSQQTRKFGRVL